MFSAAAQRSPLLQVIASSKWKKYIYIRIHVVYKLLRLDLFFNEYENLKKNKKKRKERNFG
jgi:hypothetical protein